MRPINLWLSLSNAIPPNYKPTIYSPYFLNSSALILQQIYIILAQVNITVCHCKHLLYKEKDRMKSTTDCTSERYFNYWSASPRF